MTIYCHKCHTRVKYELKREVDPRTGAKSVAWRCADCKTAVFYSKR